MEIENPGLNAIYNKLGCCLRCEFKEPRLLRNKDPRAELRIEDIVSGASLSVKMTPSPTLEVVEEKIFDFLSKSSWFQTGDEGGAEGYGFKTRERLLPSA